jgi:hypothetical protein
VKWRRRGHGLTWPAALCRHALAHAFEMTAPESWAARCAQRVSDEGAWAEEWRRAATEVDARPQMGRGLATSGGGAAAAAASTGGQKGVNDIDEMCAFFSFLSPLFKCYL